MNSFPLVRIHLFNDHVFLKRGLFLNRSYIPLKFPLLIERQRYVEETTSKGTFRESSAQLAVWLKIIDPVFNIVLISSIV